jgi:YHS domain-containing protein
MHPRFALVGLLAVFGASALAQPAASSPPPASSTQARTFVVGDTGRTFKSSAGLGSILAVHFLPEAASEHSRSVIREYSAGAPTLAGVRHIIVSAESPETFKTSLEGLPSGSIPAYRDAEGRLAARFNVPPAQDTVIVLDSAGREIYRHSQMHDQAHTPFKEFAARIAELTRDKESAEANLDSSGLALQGYDPTAYVDEHKAAPGDKQIQSSFRAVTYRFASASAREKFNADPAKYLPAYGGWCATAMAKNDKVEIDPRNFKVTGGRLFLFYKGLFGNALNDWNKDEPGLTAKADANWAKIISSTMPDK